jgi:hypothetical protein
MKKTINHLFIIVITVSVALLQHPVYASDYRNIRVSDDIELIRLSENAYIHVSVSEMAGFGKVSSNGLIFVDGNEAFLFDTPVTNSQTETLVKWIADSLLAKISTFVPNHWHDDCIGGKELLVHTSKLLTSTESSNIPVELKTLSDVVQIEVMKYAIKNDTLWVLSGDIFLYYPFGIYQSIDEFAVAYPFMHRKTLFVKNKFLDNLYYNQNSIVTVFDPTQLGNMEIVYAEISDSSVVLSNGLKVGMDKSQFMRYLPVTLQKRELNKINVVILESALLGIWNYFYFDDNQIESILIISDYQFDLSALSQTLFLAEKDEMYGYVGASGKVQIPYEYHLAFTSKLRTIAFVAEHGKIKAIDKNNNRLFTVFNIDNGPDYEQDGLFRIVDDSTGYIGFADMEGQVVIPPKYFFARPFEQGLAPFNEGGRMEAVDKEYHTIAGGKWGFIDKQGNVVFPAIFDSVSSFEDGKAKVTINNHHFYLYKIP